MRTDFEFSIGIVELIDQSTLKKIPELSFVNDQY